jgi:ribosomal protein S18 acetylase RimI-like enzyme
MNVRPAQHDDARRIAEIHVRTWQVAYPGIVPAEYLASLSVERYERMWSDNITKGTPELLVAHEADVILGWVAFGHSRDEGAEPNVAEIWAIYVDSAQWSKGVGRALWAGAQARLQDEGFVSVGLWVFPENERAGKFYRSLGFEVEAGSAKQFVLGGASLNEVHYVRRVGAGAFVWQESLAQLAKPVEPETSA